jgi:hypothetical protein
MYLLQIVCCHDKPVKFFDSVFIEKSMLGRMIRVRLRIRMRNKVYLSSHQISKLVMRVGTDDRVRVTS